MIKADRPSARATRTLASNGSCSLVKHSPNPTLECQRLGMARTSSVRSGRNALARNQTRTPGSSNTLSISVMLGRSFTCWKVRAMPANDAALTRTGDVLAEKTIVPSSHFSAPVRLNMCSCRRRLVDQSDDFACFDLSRRG
jgi:hypothetical protein